MENYRFFLAEELGIGDEVKKITEEAMSGRLEIFESLTTRVELLKGMDYQKLLIFAQIFL